MLSGRAYIFFICPHWKPWRSFSLVCFLHLDVIREQHLEELRFYSDFTRYHNAEKIVKHYKHEMIHLLQFIPQNKYCFVNQEFFFLKAILITVWYQSRKLE